MNAAITALLLLSVMSGADQSQDKFVAEGARYSFRDGVLELGPGRGWLRTPRVYLDFALAFDFKSATPELDAGVMVRTWTGSGEWPRKGYRIVLPTPGSSDPSSVMVGHRQGVTVIQKGSVALQYQGEWQQVEILGEGPRITVTLNGTLVGVYEIERYGGYVLFDNRRGRLLLRNVRIARTDPDPDIPTSVIRGDKLKAAGGQMPQLIRDVKPIYTEEALGQGVSGTVLLEVVVGVDGAPGAIRVARSLHPDLNVSAVAAARGWRFKPATLNGREVPVLVTVEMKFTTR